LNKHRIYPFQGKERFPQLGKKMENAFGYIRYALQAGGCQET
jgi:hypothetical protein